MYKVLCKKRLHNFMCANKIAAIETFELFPSPGTNVPQNGRLGLPKGPGFGIDIPEDWLREV